MSRHIFIINTFYDKSLPANLLGGLPLRMHFFVELKQKLSGTKIPEKGVRYVIFFSRRISRPPFLCIIGMHNIICTSRYIHFIIFPIYWHFSHTSFRSHNRRLIFYRGNVLHFWLFPRNLHYFDPPLKICIRKKT